jgi:hypothetical protein
MYFVVDYSLPPHGTQIVFYLFTAVQLVATATIVYLVAVEPRRNLAKAEHFRDIFVADWRQTTAKLPALPFLFYDGDFPTSWVASAKVAAAYFEERGFLRADAGQLRSIMQRAIANASAYKVVTVLLHDVIPAAITEVRDPSCTLRRFLEAGGRVVWWGDIPLHWRGLPGLMKEQWLGGLDVLSVDHYSPQYANKATGAPAGPVLWDRSDLEGKVVLTDAGRAMALAPVAKCLRPAVVGPDVIVYSELSGDLGFGGLLKDQRIAVSWRKVFSTEYPHSGFMQYPSFPLDCTDPKIVGAFFRFATSDWPFLLS